MTPSSLPTDRRFQSGADTWDVRRGSTMTRLTPQKTTEQTGSSLGTARTDAGPGAATVRNRGHQIAYETGRRAVEIVHEDLKPRRSREQGQNSGREGVMLG
jgi:hypothetical protein